MAVKIREQDNGTVVYQVTEDEQLKSNIYCEIPWCASDSSAFVFQQIGAGEAPNSTEYVVCEFGTWKTHSLGMALGGPSINYRGIFHFRRVVDHGTQELVRVTLATGKTDVIAELPADFPLRTRGRAGVSPDERYIAYGVALGYDPQRFGIEVFDLKDGSRNLITEDPYICNPHTQWEPSTGRQFLVQHNRGCVFTPDGVWASRQGPWGNSIFIVDVPSGKITRLQLGCPFTPGTTGHEAWIGHTGDILVSVRTEKGITAETGNLIRVGPGKPPVIASKGIRAGHVGTSACGRFFSCDAGYVAIGSLETGKNTIVCESETTATSEQHTHPHAYLSPDLKWAVFNSTRPGRPQIHAVSIPPEMIEGLEREG